MATQTKNGRASIEDAVDRAQEFRERLLAAGRKTTGAYLDTTERTLEGMVDLTRDIGKLYVSTARELLAK
jgi:hypothetical protein